MYDSIDDPYTYENSLVLINNYGIRDAQLLAEAEKDVYLTKISEPPPSGNFDYKHLQTLHKHLFAEIYDWAGEARIVNIAKNTNYAGTTMFAMFDRIEPELTKTLNRLNSIPIEKNNIEVFSEKVSEYFNEINAAHPFREGNGRTNRLFCSELAKTQGYYIDWDAMDQKAYIDASIQGTLNADYSVMAMLIRDNTRNYLLQNNRLYVYFQEYANRYIAYMQNKTKENKVVLDHLALKIKTDCPKDIEILYNKARKFMNTNLLLSLEAAKNIALATDNDIYSFTLILCSNNIKLSHALSN